jgi:hypothetical protein
MPRFEDYTVPEMFTGTPAAPIFSTLESSQFRTRIRNGVATGAGVWNGSWKESNQPYGAELRRTLFRHTLGLRIRVRNDGYRGRKNRKCLQAITLGQGLQVPLDNLNDMDVDVRPESSLLVLRNGCRDFNLRELLLQLARQSLRSREVHHGGHNQEHGPLADFKSIK